MGLPTTELCIGLTPITIGIDEKSRLVKEDGESTRKMKIEEFVKCLEEERSKIDAFRRELPLCFHIVKQVIDDMKEELTKSGSRVRNNNHPILEQFLPTKSMFEEKRIVLEKDNKDNKMDWMDSAHVQLWKSEIYSNKCGGNFDNLRLYRGISGISKEPEIEEKKMVSLPDLSLVTPGINSSDTSTCSLPPKEHCFYASNTKDDPLGSLSSSLNPSKRLHGQQQQQQQQNTSRKARRSWSPELHEKFVTVLNQLGGSHVATPKQIRETMKVDGLTNDEVKSHLQKYRLHVQRVHLYSSSRIEPVSYYDEGLTRHSPPFSRST